jgi:hypothetical protein
MNLARAIFIGSILLGTSFAQQPPNDIPPARWTDRTNLGFHGPVHCVMVATQKIAPDPRDLRYAKAIIDPGTEWMCFDKTGYRVETGSVLDGKVRDVVQLRRGPNGEYLGTATQNQREVRHREGDVEITETYVDDRLVTRGKVWHDAQERPTRDETYGEHGDLIVVTTNVYESSSKTIDIENFSGGQPIHHTRMIIDEVAGLQDTMQFDMAGALVAELRVNKSAVTYAWHDPDLKNVESLDSGWCETFKETVSFSFSPEGDVLREVQHHPGRYGNLEPDDVEVTDSRGVIVERVEFKYERDAHGNWINRTVLARDPKTGAVVEVERNHRELTYY